MDIDYYVPNTDDRDTYRLGRIVILGEYGEIADISPKEARDFANGLLQAADYAEGQTE